MPTFTVHVPPGIAEEVARADRTVFVREGFDWAAFVFGPLSLLYRGLWRATLAWVIAAGVLLFLAAAFGLPASARIALYFILAVLTGLEAAEARRHSLSRGGYIPVALVSASNRSAGERLFFSSPALAIPRPAATAGRPTRAGQIIGLFPHPVDRGDGAQP